MIYIRLYCKYVPKCGTANSPPTKRTSSLHRKNKREGTEARKILLPLSLTYSNLSILYASEE